MRIATTIICTAMAVMLASAAHGASSFIEFSDQTAAKAPSIVHVGKAAAKTPENATKPETGPEAGMEAGGDASDADDAITPTAKRPGAVTVMKEGEVSQAIVRSVVAQPAKTAASAEAPPGEETMPMAEADEAAQPADHEEMKTVHGTDAVVTSAAVPSDKENGDGKPELSLSLDDLRQ